MPPTLTRPRAYRTRKEQGELAEIYFLLKATLRGFTISKPWGDSRRYDFVLDNGFRLMRIQVKSVSRIMPGQNHFRAHASTQNGAKPYTTSQIDFLAAYVFPLDTWYIIPAHVLRGRECVHLMPHVAGSRAEFEPFRETWDLLRG